MLDYRIEERMSVEDAVAAPVDMDYSEAYYKEKYLVNMGGGWQERYGNKGPEIKQRITSKWETVPSQPAEAVIPPKFPYR